MKALCYPAWGELEVRDVPTPSLADGEVLVRVSDCGVCGSELESFLSQSVRRTPPLIMGHEFCGRIEEVRNVPSEWVCGQRVIAHALVHCGTCAMCIRGDTNLCIQRQVFGMHRPGGFAEYVAVPERVLIPWPDDMCGSVAVFTEPLANGINAMRRGGTARRSRVLIIGAGPIGLMCLYAAKQLHQSSVVISDIIPQRLCAARTLGADLTVEASKQSLTRDALGFWGDESAEYVIDAVGSAETKRLSLELVEPGGNVVWVGLHQDLIDLNSYDLTLGQRSVSGSYSGSLNDFRQAAELLAAKPFDTRWVTNYPLESGETAFREMSGDGKKIKAILQLDENMSRC
jgi:threonine dehydrogenase-like Zn-dependent dehydrogenase